MLFLRLLMLTLVYGCLSGVIVRWKSFQWTWRLFRTCCGTQSKVLYYRRQARKQEALKVSTGVCGSWQSSAVWAFPRLSSSHTPVKGWRVTKRLWAPAVHSTGHNCLAYCFNVFSVHSTLVITACLGFIRLLLPTTDIIHQPGPQKPTLCLMSMASF